MSLACHLRQEMFMRIWTWALLFLSLTSSAGATEDAERPPDLERPPLVLGQGEQRLLKIPGLTRYSIGSPCVHVHGAPASPGLKDDLLIKGVCPGHADLWVSKVDGSTEHRSIRIEKIAPEDLPLPLARALGHLEETEVFIAGSGVILRGEIQRLRELDRIRGLRESFPKEIHDETEPSLHLVEEAEALLDQWIKKTPQASRLAVERQGL
jgi:hypothetical protein